MQIANMQRQPLRYFSLWLAVGWLLIAVVLQASLTSDPLQTPGIEFGDKIGHFTAYFSLVFWFCQLYKRKKAHLLLFALFVFMGVAIEFIQGQTGYRTFEVADMLANSSGAVVGLLLVRFYAAEMLLTLEMRLLHKR
ncbi:MAG: VanZ family protein [Candidatus Polarisedimenticolaceae bacterium]|nr:VanZ family protein [Candidatus Polarisedimenticolaceae bacterium]